MSRRFIQLQDPHHEYEFYPGTGKEDFCTTNIYNQPMPPLWETEQSPWRVGVSRSSRKHDCEGGRLLFRKVIETRLLPLLRSFSPDLIMVSSGGSYNGE